MTEAEAADRTTLLALAVATERFTQAEADALLGSILSGHAEGALGPDHRIWVLRTDAHEKPVGWSYFAPDPYAPGVWNVWWIGVHPGHHGTGAGSALLSEVEAHIRKAGGRVIIIETSDSDALARARSFYRREGYLACGTIPDFYAPGEGKVIFARSLLTKS